MLLRHGKSQHGFEYASDFERPLAPRGEKAAARMGRLLTELDLVPEMIISSPANRALSTARLVQNELDEVELETNDGLYSSSLDDYYDVIANLDAGVHSVLLVGHNFTIEDFADDLIGEEDTVFKTCSLAVISVPDLDWDVIGPGDGELKGLYHPRQLKD